MCDAPDPGKEERSMSAENNAPLAREFQQEFNDRECDRIDDLVAGGVEW
jgi:hypothetical protein